MIEVSIWYGLDEGQDAPNEALHDKLAADHKAEVTFREDLDGEVQVDFDVPDEENARALVLAAEELFGERYDGHEIFFGDRFHLTVKE